jgi:hypothetical protein
MVRMFTVRCSTTPDEVRQSYGEERALRAGCHCGAKGLRRDKRRCFPRGRSSLRSRRGVSSFLVSSFHVSSFLVSSLGQRPKEGTVARLFVTSSEARQWLCLNSNLRKSVVTFGNFVSTNEERRYAPLLFRIRIRQQRPEWECRSGV